MDKTILIMAAGMGSRYGGLKQIDAMGPAGEILMEYAVYDAIQAGFSKVVFVIKESMREDFEQSIGRRLRGSIEVDYAIQRLEDLPRGFAVPQGREKPWGTGQAILCAAAAVTEPFAVFNADDFYGRDAFRKMASWLDAAEPTELAGAMVGYRIRNTLSPHGAVTRGICKTDGSHLTGVEEIPKISREPSGTIVSLKDDQPHVLSGDEVCSMNYWGFTPELFAALSADFRAFLTERGRELKSEWLIPEIVDRFIRRGLFSVQVLTSDDAWFGVTYPEDKPQVGGRLERLVEQGVYPSPLFPA